jgi:ribosome-binding factor A
MNFRSDRLAEELKNEISTIIAQEVRDPRVGFATITEVKVSPDRRYARVYLSVLGEPEERRETLAALDSAGSFIRRRIGARLQLRYTPQLTFTYDESVERGERLTQLFDDLKKESTG